MAESLKVKTKYAIFWNAIEKLGTQLIGAIVAIVLAREFLTEYDYGLIAMLSIFIAISTSLIEGGLSAALVRKIDIKDIDYNTAFYVNFGISLVLYLFFWFLAPFIASFYEEPILIPIVRISFVVLIINAVGFVQSSIVVRDVAFKKLSLINLTSLVLAGSAAITVAYLGGGVWALVTQMIGVSLVKTVSLWVLGNWNPQWSFSRASYKELFSFGINVALSGILNALFLNIYAAVIGKFNKAQLGYYAQGVRLSDMAITSLYGTIQNATYTILAKVQNEQERLIMMFRRTMRLTAFVTLPVLSALAFVSRPFILLLLTDKWESAIVYLQILCIAGIFTSFTVINTNYIKVVGNSRLLLRIEVIKLIVIAVALLFTYRCSVFTIVMGQAIARFFVYIITIVLIGNNVKYRWYLQLKDIFPYVALTIPSIGVAWLVSLLPLGIYATMFLQLFVIFAVYILLAYWLKSYVLREALHFFSKK